MESKIEKALISRDLLNNSFTYSSYRELVDQLFAENKTTGENHSEAMLEYTKLNLARMKRLDKTTKLTEDSKQTLGKSDKKVTWLVITEAWCGDAAQIVPVLNKLAEANENIDMKVILRDENLEIMDQFLTNGGRSIPKVVALDTESLEVISSWGPRPSELQNMVMDVKQNSPDSDTAMKEIKKTVQQWYNADKTVKIQKEGLEVLLGQ